MSTVCYVGMYIRYAVNTHDIQHIYYTLHTNANTPYRTTIIQSVQYVQYAKYTIYSRYMEVPIHGGYSVPYTLYNADGCKQWEINLFCIFDKLLHFAVIPRSYPDVAVEEVLFTCFSVCGFLPPRRHLRWT